MKISSKGMGRIVCSTLQSNESVCEVCGRPHTAEAVEDTKTFIAHVYALRKSTCDFMAPSTLERMYFDVHNWVTEDLSRASADNVEEAYRRYLSIQFARNDT